MARQYAINVEYLSKKFCRSLKRSMLYGLYDVGRVALIPSRFRSRHFQARISDAAGEPVRVPREARAEESGGLSKAPSSGGPSHLPPLRRSEFWALRDINLRVRASERVGLVGVNGAGKSTLFSILSNIYAPTVGCVRIHGRLQALIALGAGFHPSLSGRENIYINGAILGMGTKEIDRNIEDIIEFSGIRDFIDAPIKTYSSGMLVRLAFSVAAQMRPDILLLDEVLSVGDGSFQAKCLKRAAELTQNGCTVVLVSHNLLRIKAFSERCIWLHDGQIWADGSTSEIVTEYDTFLARQSGRSRAGSVTCLRRGSGLVTIESYQLSNGNQEVLPMPEDGGLPEVQMGQDLGVRFSYVVKDGNCGRLSFHVSIKEPESGVEVTSARSRFLDRICPSGHRGEVKVCFPRIPLREGEYCLYLGIGDDRLYGYGAHDVIDEISPSFRIVPTAETFVDPHGPIRAALVDLPHEFVRLT